MKSRTHLHTDPCTPSVIRDGFDRTRHPWRGAGRSAATMVGEKRKDTLSFPELRYCEMLLAAQAPSIWRGGAFQGQDLGTLQV